MLVVLTSGSEGAGYSHKTTIAEHLESLLNEKSPRKVRVLNLSMNSYCISQEISTFVHLAWHLKPEIVVSLSGWNDMAFGQLVPAEFNKLGLHTPNFLETWSATIHPSNPTRENIWAPRSGSNEIFSPEYPSSGWAGAVAGGGIFLTMGTSGFVGPILQRWARTPNAYLVVLHALFALLYRWVRWRSGWVGIGSCWSDSRFPSE